MKLNQTNINNFFWNKFAAFKQQRWIINDKLTMLVILLLNVAVVIKIQKTFLMRLECISSSVEHDAIGSFFCWYSGVTGIIGLTEMKLSWIIN